MSYPNEYECAACDEAAVMLALGWDDYYCRKHKEVTDALSQ